MGGTGSLTHSSSSRGRSRRTIGVHELLSSPCIPLQRNDEVPPQTCRTTATLDAILQYMRPVAVIGIGKTAFGAFPDRDLRSLAVEAGEKAMADANVNPSKVEAFYLGNFAGPSFVGQNHLAPYIAGAMGVTGVPATRFEAACASSGSAFFHAVAAVGSGMYDLVLVGGVEKMTSQTNARTAEIL